MTDSLLYEIIRGHANPEGVQVINKYGRNPDVDIATDPEDMWTQGGTYTFLSSAATLYVSSSNAGDTQQVVIVGLDANWLQQTGYATLNGQSQVEIKDVNGSAITFIRVYRAYANGATATSGDIYIAETDDLTAGVPNTATKIKAKIDATDQQTQMSIMSVPANMKGFLLDWYAGIQAGSAAATKVNLSLQARDFGKAFRTKMFFGLNSDNNPHVHHTYPAGRVYEPKTDIKLVVNSTDKDNLDIAGGFTILLAEVT